MSAAPDEPAWERLPDDPLGFFGLAPGFELLELRRRYGRLIKRHRPDDDPQAFARIRAAYEVLEPLAASPAAEGDRAPAPPGVTASLQAALAAPDAAAALRELEAGLGAHPGDPRLLALLEAVAADLPPVEAEPALRRLAALLPPAELLRRTGALWRAWLREAPPDRFEAAWNELVQAPLVPGERAPLVLSLLRPAALRLSPAWLAAARATLGDVAGPALDEGGVDHDLDLLPALELYRRAREDFLAAGHPLRARLDRAILDLVDGLPDGPRRALELLVDVHDGPRATLEGLGASAPDAAAVLVLDRLVDDLARQGRLGLSAAAAEPPDGAPLAAVPASIEGVVSAALLAGAAMALGVVAAVVTPLGLHARHDVLVTAAVAVGAWGALRLVVRRVARRRPPDPAVVADAVAWGGVALRALDGTPAAPLARAPALRLVELARRWAHG